MLMETIRMILDFYFKGLYKLEKAEKVTSAYTSSLFYFYTLHLFDTTYLLCELHSEIKVKQLIFQYEELSFTDKVIFFFTSPSTYLMKKMIQKNIPFLSDQKQIFLPMIYLNVFESKKKTIQGYTKAVQQVAEFYFFEKNQEYSVSQIQEKLPISRASISRANIFLFTIGAIDKKGLGTRAKFKRKNPAEFFQMIKPYLINPIEDQCYVNKDCFNDEDILALSSDSALSFYTSLNEMMPSYVIEKVRFQEYKKQAIPFEEIDEIEAPVCLETFRYQPVYLKNMYINVLDIISIFKDSKDNRVQIEIEELEDQLNDQRIGEIY